MVRTESAVEVLPGAAAGNSVVRVAGEAALRAAGNAGIRPAGNAGIRPAGNAGIRPVRSRLMVAVSAGSGVRPGGVPV